MAPRKEVCCFIVLCSNIVDKRTSWNLNSSCWRTHLSYHNKEKVGGLLMGAIGKRLLLERTHELWGRLRPTKDEGLYYRIQLSQKLVRLVLLLPWVNVLPPGYFSPSIGEFFEWRQGPDFVLVPLCTVFILIHPLRWRFVPFPGSGLVFGWKFLLVSWAIDYIL